jgi:hypothetical protein
MLSENDSLVNHKNFSYLLKNVEIGGTHGFTP